MMNKPKLFLGPPGCGKTHALIDVVRDALENQGLNPEEIGFLSFTRKAVEEAGMRAGKAFDLTPDQMPYFKTLHAMGFRQLGLRKDDVMGKSDWKDLADDLGMRPFQMSGSVSDLNAYLPHGSTTSSRYLRVLERSKMRCVTLEQEFNEAADYDLNWEQLVKLQRTLNAYRDSLGKVTFVDMLTLFLAAGTVPKLALLIVDEAQDLTPLQWRIVWKMAAAADRVYFAGDDDQAIHAWAGVDIKEFLSCTDRIQVLDQSYRLPRTIFDLSQIIVNRITQRLPKEYNPTPEEGAIQFHNEIHDVDMSHGSWTLLARTNANVETWCNVLRAEGHLFSQNGVPSLTTATRATMAAWNKYRAHKPLNKKNIRDLCAQLHEEYTSVSTQKLNRLLRYMGPGETLTKEALDKAIDLYIPMSRHIAEMIRPSLEEARYLRALIRRGVDPATEPRIKVSTIHRMKGGEDDNIALLLQRPNVNWRWDVQSEEDEHRVFYVGMTRAKKNLHLIEPSGGARYHV